ncbi:MAG TPA: ChbG/HpnK family deacetylase [Agriterribacter sp.]|nr:ChbG/HpnK family deacetylase [Chitinophagaceae bacterium]HRP31784.1 ChbG/HpnK family deacetylase [Agriterribacter sp.]
MIRLITNADDFGLTRSVTDAIIDSHLNGIMTSTTIMVNTEGTDYAIGKAKEITSLGVGIHFNLTEGKPLSDPNQVPDLLNEDGRFKSNEEQRRNLLFGKQKLIQAKRELQAQLEYLLDNNLTPTHYDSHHHITGVPVSFRASMEVAKQFNIRKARITNIDFWYQPGYSNFPRQLKNTLLSFPKSFIHHKNKRVLRNNGFTTPDYKVLPARVYPFDINHINQFVNTLSVLKGGVTEISFHPGYPNSNPRDAERTAQLRPKDLEVAKSEIIKNYIRENNIQLINYRSL